MDGPQIDQKIRFGYAKAAQKLGSPYDLYRSALPINPIQQGNFVGQLKMVPSQDWTWMKANRPGNAIWFVCVDGQDSSLPLSAQEGDYLVAGRTFFILSKEYQLPMQAVECNVLVNVIRPNYERDPGFSGGYMGYHEYVSPGDPSNSLSIMQNMPMSLLMYKQGKIGNSKLPTDTTQASWIGLMPNLGDVNIRIGDILVGLSNIDSLSTAGIVPISENFIITGTEETEFGWRLTCIQVMN